MNAGLVFCVSIHDVAVSTWLACEHLLDRLPVLQELPLTLLLVPDWHGQGRCASAEDQRFQKAITAIQVRGHELCLHGYTHSDQKAAGLSDWWQRRVLTRSEGEFAALGACDAGERLRLGKGWLAERGWQARGFVPPAWMINPEGIRAVRDAGFEYLGRYRGWQNLANGKNIAAPTITYSVRHPAGDALWRSLQDVLLLNQQRRPVLRLALHPADLHRAGNLAHASRLIAQWRRYRVPLTEYQAYLQHASKLAVVQQERIGPM